MSALFVNMEGAFDLAPHQGVRYKLASMGVTGITLAWFSDFPFGHPFQVAVGASKSSSHPIRRDVPQGGVLSSLLFNVLMLDLQILHHLQLI